MSYNRVSISPVDSGTNGQFFGKNKNVPQIMGMVLLAAIPGIAMQTFCFGWGSVINIIWCSMVALIAEAFILHLRRYSIRHGLSDYSALVTACLLAVSLPPLVPWWVSAVGTVFAIIVGKQLYGGLGQNIFNPAMVGYAFLLVSFPSEMTCWTTPVSVDGKETIDGFWQAFYIIFGDLSADSVSSVTILDVMRTNRLNPTGSLDLYDSSILEVFAGRGYIWVNTGYLLGGLFLLSQKIFTWHAPVAMLAAILGMSTLVWLWEDQHTLYGTPGMHLFSGATMLGAFFIITDPVSGAAGKLGKVIFAGGVGILIYVIRAWGGYPDSVAFSVLLMNIAVPFIDLYTQPRVHGYEVFNKKYVKPRE